MLVLICLIIAAVCLGIKVIQGDRDPLTIVAFVAVLVAALAGYLL